MVCDIVPSPAVLDAQLLKVSSVDSPPKMKFFILSDSYFGATPIQEAPAPGFQIAIPVPVVELDSPHLHQVKT